MLAPSLAGLQGRRYRLPRDLRPARAAAAVVAPRSVVPPIGQALGAIGRLAKQVHGDAALDGQDLGGQPAGSAGPVDPRQGAVEPEHGPLQPEHVGLVPLAPVGELDHDSHAAHGSRGV